MATAGWGDLPLGLLLLIVQRLLVDDVIRVRAVCRWWACSLGNEASGCRPPQSYCIPSPWMLLPNPDGEAADSCTFIDIAEGRRRTVHLPQIIGRRIFGSSPDGWLVTVDPFLNPRVLNPFSREELPLPSLTTIPRQAVPVYSLDRRSIEGFHCEHGGSNTWPPHVFRDHLLSKIILTSDPTQGGIAVAFCAMNMFKCFVAFSRVGDNAWARGPSVIDGIIEDVIYHKADDKLYAVNRSGAVFVIAYMRPSSSWELISMVAPRIAEVKCHLNYLRRKYITFSSCGDLLQISRELDYTLKREEYFQCFSKKIAVFRFDPNCYRRHEDQHGGKSDPPTCSSCWVLVNDLGDESIFLGSNHTFSLLASDEFGVKKNRIYFTDGMHFVEFQKSTVCDVGVLHLECNRLELFFSSDCQINWPPPIFFMPNPKFLY